MCSWLRLGAGPTPCAAPLLSALTDHNRLLPRACQPRAWYQEQLNFEKNE